MINKVTLWFKTKYKLFNHLEDDWSTKGSPALPQMDKREIWNKRWAFIEGYDEDIPTVVPQYWSES